MTFPRVRLWLQTFKNLAALQDIIKDMYRLLNLAPEPAAKLWKAISNLTQRQERAEDRIQGLTRLYAGDDNAERLPTRHDAPRPLSDDIWGIYEPGDGSD